MSVEINVTTSNSPQITFDEARKRIGKMNLINRFMFDSVLEDKEKGIIVVKGILDTVLDMDVPISSVESQKILTGLDSVYHGIRFDVCIDKEKEDEYNAVVYDIEMEDFLVLATQPVLLELLQLIYQGLVMKQKVQRINFLNF